MIVTTYRGVGAGVALLDAVVAHARDSGWKRLWLVTTNDNTDALRIYQRVGWHWVGFHRNGVDEARVLKPELPKVGHHGIAIVSRARVRIPAVILVALAPLAAPDASAITPGRAARFARAVEVGPP